MGIEPSRHFQHIRHIIITTFYDGISNEYMVKFSMKIIISKWIIDFNAQTRAWCWMILLQVSSDRDVVKYIKFNWNYFRKLFLIYERILMQIWKLNVFIWLQTNIVHVQDTTMSFLTHSMPIQLLKLNLKIIGFHSQFKWLWLNVSLFVIVCRHRHRLPYCIKSIDSANHVILAIFTVVHLFLAIVA